MFFFVSIKLGKIGLVIGKNIGYQFDIWVVIVGQIFILCLVKFIVFLILLFFIWCNMVVGNVQ